ncbi:MAG: HAMP domain-containing protein [Nitrococcus mobilis]|nr:HAMP domain-containing protein [Nitrococcus mobilis]
MSSLHTRLLLAASCVLVVFIAGTGLALDHAVYERTLHAERDKLQGLLYAVLGAAELDSDDVLTVVLAQLPEDRLAQPQSGLYALLLDADAEVVWQSPSLLFPAPTVVAPAVGQWRFQNVSKTGFGPVFALSFGIRWLGEDAGGRRYTVVALEDRTDFDAQLRQFRANLWTWLIGAAVLLLVIQLLVLRWSLLPLGRLMQELRHIEAGERDTIGTSYPDELQPLVGALNAMLEHERRQRARYRNALADLAHSLKTPLSVLQGIAQSNEHSSSAQRRVALEQLSRMGDIVDYQLKRAGAAGRQVLRRPVPVGPVVERLIAALQKVYRDKTLQFELQIIPAALALRADEDDLMEILGNLLDNAAKWAQGRIDIRAERSAEQWVIQVDDDGPGFPAQALERLRERGARADTRTEGQGIGLAIVDELVQSYGGTLSAEPSPLGGARLVIRIPARSL